MPMLLPVLHNTPSQPTLHLVVCTFLLLIPVLPLPLSLTSTRFYSQYLWGLFAIGFWGQRNCRASPHQKENQGGFFAPPTASFVSFTSEAVKVRAQKSFPCIMFLPNQHLFPWKPYSGMGCHSLLQRIFLTQGSNWGLLHCSQILYHLSYQGSPLLFYIYI